MPNMMRVGGRTLNITLEEVAHKLNGVEPEPIREHLVELHGTVYPPKQVLAVVTGWDRQSYTTMEAQRVLNKLGLVCRRAGSRPDGTPAWVLANVEELAAASPAWASLEARIARLESDLSVAQAAITGLNARVTLLEAA